MLQEDFADSPEYREQIRSIKRALHRRGRVVLRSAGGFAGEELDVYKRQVTFQVLPASKVREMFLALLPPLTAEESVLFDSVRETVLMESAVISPSKV